MPNLQMMLGNCPVLTKGPLSLFLGGEEFMETLGDDVPGKAVLHLCVFSIFFMICNSVYKKVKTEKLNSVSDYAMSLRATIVNNVINMYSLVAMFIGMITLLIYLLRPASH